MNWVLNGLKIFVWGNAHMASMFTSVSVFRESLFSEFREVYRAPGIKSRSATYKENALLIALLHWPPYSILNWFFCKIWNMSLNHFCTWLASFANTIPWRCFLCFIFILLASFSKFNWLYPNIFSKISTFHWSENLKDFYSNITLSWFLKL